ncbi:MAG: hypothetical protein QM820_14420 [Minicystis sp.]
MHRWIRALVALAAPAALFACNNINLNIEQNDVSGCCCNTCGCQDGSGGAGGEPATTSTTTSSGTGGVPSEKCLCPEGYTATPAGDACVKETFSDPIQNAVVYTACPGDQKWVYGKFGARVEPGGTAPGGTTEMNAYWGDGATSPLDGRLNNIGVWACGDDGTTAGTEPIGEWIGFSVCVNVPASGDYILGIAGDNRVSMNVDGTNVYLDDTGSTSAFDYWHLLPIHLTSGTHIVELRGKNDGSIAAFGAEISGPFAVGSLNTDAVVLDETAYAANIIWSTENLPAGQQFDLGEKSGWQCPGETALDLCAPKPVCRHVEQVSCIGIKDPVTKQ